MSSYIKKDRQGVIFDSEALIYRQGMSLQDLVKRDPLKSSWRSNFFRSLISGVAKRLNPNIRAMMEATKEFDKVMEYNQKLIDKGLDPKNPKDRDQFKKFDPNKLAALTATFAGK